MRHGSRCRARADVAGPENLVAEIKTLLANHNLLEAVIILQTINTSLAASRTEAEAANRRCIEMIDNDDDDDRPTREELHERYAWREGEREAGHRRSRAPPRANRQRADFG